MAEDTKKKESSKHDGQMKKCPKCGAQVVETATKCHSCGHIPRGVSPSWKDWNLIE